MDKTKLINLKQIKKKLIEEFGHQLLSAIVYGSTLEDDYCAFSDYDILLIFDYIDYDTFKKIRRIKRFFKANGVNIDFNSHTYSELPQTRKEIFWHNNRSIYIQKELAIYGKVLFGKKYFKDLKLDHQTMLSEAVKVISSLNYQLRKTLSNKNLNTTNRITIMKWCIYSVMYYLAAQNYFPKGRKEALVFFNHKYNPPINPETFLEAKIYHPSHITSQELKNAFIFLTYIDHLIFNQYKKESHDRA